ncbi:MAG: hypothetical protein PWQ79_1348 [Thermococcaceae archaeon]|nr:hypothetical protein [Thermococcaceae archaeon]
MGKRGFFERVGKFIVILWLVLSMLSINLLQSGSSTHQQNIGEIGTKYPEEVSSKELQIINGTGDMAPIETEPIEPPYSNLEIQAFKAERVLIEDFPYLNSNYGLLLIRGVDLNDPETFEAYQRFKNQLPPSFTVFSYYDLVSQLKEDSSIAATNLTVFAANTTHVIYNALLSANRTYGTYLEESKQIAPLANALGGTIPELLKMREELSKNLSSTQRTILDIKSAIQTADRIYPDLHENLSATKNKVQRTSIAFEKLHEDVYSIRHEYFIIYLRSMYTYNFLRNTLKAYERGVLPPCLAGEVCVQTGMDEDFLYAVFYATLPAYRRYGYDGITDTLLANFTVTWVVENQSDDLRKMLAESFGELFYEKVVSIDSAHGNNLTILKSGSYDSSVVYKLVDNLTMSVLEELPNKISNSEGSYYLPSIGTVDASTFSAFLQEAISLGENPASPELNSALLKLLPLLPDPPSKELAAMLLGNETASDIEKRLLSKKIEEILPPTISNLSEAIAAAVVDYETSIGYSGGLRDDPEALKEILVRVVDIAGIASPEDVEKVLSEDTTEILKERMKVDAELLLTQRGIETTEELLSAIVDSIISTPTEKVSKDTITEISADVISRVYGEDSSKIVKALYEVSSPEDAAKKIFSEWVREETSSVQVGQIVGALSQALEEIPNIYPLSPEELKAMTIEIFKKAISDDTVIIYGTPVRIPTEKLSEVGWELKDIPDSIDSREAENIAEIIYSELVKAHESDISALKSNDNRSMSVILNHYGTLETPEEMEEMTKVKTLALAEFRGVSPSAEVSLLHFENHVNTYNDPVGWRVPLYALILGFVAFLLLTGFSFVKSLTALLSIGAGLSLGLALSSRFLTSYWPSSLSAALMVGLGYLIAGVYFEEFREKIAGYEDGNPYVSYGALRVSIVAAGALIPAFGMLAVNNVPAIREMGISGIFTTLTILASLWTILPSTAALIGDKMLFWWPRSGESVLEPPKYIELKEFSMSRAVGVIAIAIILLAPSLLLLSSFAPGEEGYISGELPAGNELYAILNLDGSLESKLGLLNSITGDLKEIPGISGVYTLTSPYGIPINAPLQTLVELGGGRYISQNGSSVVIVMTTEDSADIELVDRVREALAENRADEIKGLMLGGRYVAEKELSDATQNALLKAAILSLIAGGLLLSVLYGIRLGTIPLVIASTGASAFIVALISLLLRDFLQISHWIVVLAMTLALFGTIPLLGALLEGRRGLTFGAIVGAPLLSAGVMGVLSPIGLASGLALVISGFVLYLLITFPKGEE